MLCALKNHEYIIAEFERNASESMAWLCGCLGTLGWFYRRIYLLLSFVHGLHLDVRRDYFLFSS